jgi:hypothetical protein
MLDAVTKIGVTKIILALSEMQTDLCQYVKGYQSRHPTVHLIPSVERVPLVRLRLRRIIFAGIPSS